MTDSIYSAILEAQSKGLATALCTVIKSSGSVPRHESSKMLVYLDGRFVGTIGGGEMESRVIEAAKSIARTGEAKIVEYNLVDPNHGDPGVCGGTVEIFIEPINPPATILIIGAGHVGRATAKLAKWLGFRVIVADDRADLASRDWIPEADQYVTGSTSQQLEQVAINAQTYILSLTRGVKIDIENLPALLDMEPAYIGVIGSRRRWQTALKELRAKGVSHEKLKRVHAPIGLELNAETP